MTNDETSLFPVFLASRQLEAPASSHGRVKTIVRLARNVRRAPFVIRHSSFVILSSLGISSFVIYIRSWTSLSISKKMSKSGNVTTK